MAIIDGLLQELEQEAKTTRRVLERVPDNHLTWRAHPKARTLGDLAFQEATRFGTQFSEFPNGCKCFRIKRSPNCGRVAQLGEHLLCKHACISPKSLNRRLLSGQNPLVVGLLIGLQKIRIIHLKTKPARMLERYPGRFHLLAVLPEAPKGN